MQPDQVVRRSERAVFRELTEDEGAVLLHLDTGAYHGLNPTGALIWDLVGEGSTLADIVRELRTGLAEPPPDLNEDVAAFISDLAQRDLLLLGEPDN